MFLLIIRRMFGVGSAPEVSATETVTEPVRETSSESSSSGDRPPLRFAGDNDRDNRDSRQSEEDAETDDDEEVIEAQTQVGDPMAELADVDEVEEEDTRRGGRDRRQAPQRSRVDSPKEFFSTEMLYLYDLLLPEEREALNGRYRIELKGYNGGIWTVVCDKDLQVLNTREEADVVLSMQQSDFIEIVNGDLNPQLAILAQKVRLSGDVKKAVRFQSLLAPGEE